MPGQTGEMPGLSGNGPVNLGTAAMVMLDLDGLKSVMIHTAMKAAISISERPQYA